MRNSRRPLLLLPLLAATIVAGCSAVGSVTPDPDQETAAALSQTAPAADADSDAGTEPAAHRFPRISSCDQLAPIVAPYIQGLSLDPENADVQPDAVHCQWKQADGTITQLTDIQTYSVRITTNEGEVPDPAEAAAYGINMYFTDPRLDALGGVGLWFSADTAAVGSATGSVIVPGAEIGITDSRWGQEAQSGREALVTTALAILDL